MEKVKNVCSNVFAWIKSHVLVIAIVVAVIVVAALLVSFVGGAQKRAINKYISAVNSCNDKKIIKAMNTKAAVVWNSISKSKLDDFKDELEDVDDDDIDSFEDTIKKRYDSSDKGKNKIKLKKIIYTTKAKDNKDITKVVCQVRMTSKPDGDDDDGDDIWKSNKKFTTQVESYMTFYLYKNKVIGTSYDI